MSYEGGNTPTLTRDKLEGWMNKSSVVMSPVAKANESFCLLGVRRFA